MSAQTVRYSAAGRTPEFGTNYFALSKKRKRWENPSVVRLPKIAVAAKPPIRLAAPPALVGELMAVQGGRCYMCGGEFSRQRPDTLEHVTPKSLGGRKRGNLLLAHRDCNEHKADRPPRPCELIYLEAANTLRRCMEAA